MTPSELAQKLDAMQIIDVRDQWEWNAGRIDAAQHLPMGEIIDRVAEVDRDRAVAVVCRSGQRSAQVTAWLSGQGYDAHNLEGGMHAWARAGLPLPTPAGQPGRVV